jgi:hypothetical protein
MPHTPVTVSALVAKFEATRSGVSDPARMVAAELHNITDVLVELLKELRRKA